MKTNRSSLVFLFFLTLGYSNLSAQTTYKKTKPVENIGLNECTKNEEIEDIISDAINLGAPLYNEGLHLACYKIYEWAAYKIIYEYTPVCKDACTIIKTAIDKSHGDLSDTEKAWLMRGAFDKVLGVATEKEPVIDQKFLKKG